MPDLRIFISHSSQDVQFTVELENALKMAGADAWHLDQHVRGPLEIGPLVEQQLRERNVFIVLLSPASLHSEWVDMESRWYWNRWRREKDSRFILPVIVRDISLNDLWDFLSDFKRVGQRGGVALPKQETIEQIRLELGLDLVMGQYPADVLEPIREKYVALGAIASGLGRPRYVQDNDAHPHISQRGTSGYVYPFEHGVICWCEMAKAHPIWWGAYDVHTHYRSFAPGARLGFPLTDEVPAASSPQGTEGTFQRFEGAWFYPDDVPNFPGVPYGATIYYSKYGAFATFAGIGECYERLGGTGSFLGFPTSNEQDAAPSPQHTTGYYQTFEGGIIHWCDKYNSVPVTGRILSVYNKHAGSGGDFGFPIRVAEKTELPDGRIGRLQRFEGGIIYVEEEHNHP